jgi:hypothetical protein
MVQPTSKQKPHQTNAHLLYMQSANFARRSRENFAILKGDGACGKRKFRTGNMFAS